MSNNLSGTGVALLTPFDKQNKVDYAALERLISYVAKGGVNYLVILGTTAETPTLTAVEQQEIVEHVKKYNTTQLPIVIGVGGNSTADVLAKIAHTNFEGVAAVLSVTPYYNRPSQQGLYEHYKALAEASPVPIVLYNIPVRTGVNLLPETTLRLAHEVSNIVAIKEGSGSAAQVAKILRDKPKDFLVISGDDSETLPFMSLGAQGVISVAANAFPHHISQMVNAATQQDYKTAAKIHLQMINFIEACFAEGNPVGIKAALTELGIIQNNLRLPLVPASAALVQRMKNLVTSL